DHVPHGGFSENSGLPFSHCYIPLFETKSQLLDNKIGVLCQFTRAATWVRYAVSRNIGISQLTGTPM
ncbi:MAG: hypothetical protein ACTHJY_21870, partial [Rhizobiaceae bacterium]